MKNLKLRAIERRLKTLLAFHGKLVMENKDGRRMHRTARLIRLLTRLYEAGQPRLRYEGPICKDVPSEEVWTVIDRDSPHFKMTNMRETLLEMGFTAEELDSAKNNNC